MLHAVTFDYWNTLFVDVRGRQRERRRTDILLDELAACGVRPPRTAVDDALQGAFDFFDRVWVGEHRTPSCGEIVDSVLATLGARPPAEVRDRIASRFELIVLDLPPEPVPGAFGALPRLAARYRLAVVCDTGYSPGRVLREVLQRNGMLSYFQYLFFSDEHGRSKPDPEVFWTTLGELGVRPGEAVHVGDIQRTDIAGAQGAGMSAVLFVGANNHDSRLTTADLVVRHFDDLPDALGGLICAGC